MSTTWSPSTGVERIIVAEKLLEDVALMYGATIVARKTQIALLPPVN